MVQITDKDGVVSLQATDYELKIDKARQIYVKKINESKFKSIGSEVPLGLTLDEKKKYLYNLHQMIEKKRREQGE